MVRIRSVFCVQMNTGKPAHASRNHLFSVFSGLLVYWLWLTGLLVDRFTCRPVDRLTGLVAFIYYHILVVPRCAYKWFRICFCAPPCVTMTTWCGPDNLVRAWQHSYKDTGGYHMHMSLSLCLYLSPPRCDIGNRCVLPTPWPTYWNMFCPLRRI